MKPKLSDEDKIDIINHLDGKIGPDINNLEYTFAYKQELSLKKIELEQCLEHFTNIHKYKSDQTFLHSRLINDQVSAKYVATIAKAESNLNQIEDLKNKIITLQKKIKDFLSRTNVIRLEVDKKFFTISKLKGVLFYLETFKRFNEVSDNMKQCHDNEILLQYYGQMKDICSQYTKGHQATYFKECTHYWHNVLKDTFTKHYEEVLKAIKWPVTSSSEISPAPKEALMKFSNLTRYLYILEEPEDLTPNTGVEDMRTEVNASLPVKILLRPLKKRFVFHFTGNRQTARIDRPEWFLTQTLNWIKDHRNFINDHVQPVADKLEMTHINAVDEFNNGLISCAAERLHTVLGLYTSQSAKGEIVDVDAAFAHAVDETLGFHRELQSVTGRPMNMVLDVLTKAENFVRWIAVEKKYALSKMDEALDNEQWSEPVAAGAEVAVGTALWVPRSADWFITLLKTIEDRYAMLPQPGHRLQFLELQLELIEEWRIRLTQMMGASLHELQVESFLTASGPHPLTSLVNAAHYTRSVLLLWAQSLHYLQLHFYRRQFVYFTQQHNESETSDSYSGDGHQDINVKKSPTTDEIYAAMTINELEYKAKMLALSEMSERNSVACEPPPGFEMCPPCSRGNISSHDQLHFYVDSSNDAVAQFIQRVMNATNERLEDYNIAMAFRNRDPKAIDHANQVKALAASAKRTAPNNKTGATEQQASQLSQTEEAGVFGETPNLFAHLRDAGLSSLSDHILLEFKATIRDYKNQKWHAMLMVEEMALSVSGALCGPLSALCARMAAAAARLAPPLTCLLRTHLAAHVDHMMLHEMVLETWFNTGGTLQFTHDVKRNLVPAFAPHNKSAAQLTLLPKLLEACKILNMDYDDARHLRTHLVKQSFDGAQKDGLNSYSISHLQPSEALKILSQRTDLADTSTPSSVMELF